MCVFASCQVRAQWPVSFSSERARLAEITGTALPGDSGLQSRSRIQLRILAPAVGVVWNSAIPYTLNDGPLWAGRGVNVSANAGASGSVRTRFGRIRLVAAPTFAYSQNSDFPIMPGTTPGRSAYASPFHGPESSADLPLRFGDRPLYRLDPGASELAVQWKIATARVTAANDWWGPGIRNAIVMSNNATGIPRAELVTTRPLRTRFGALQVKGIAGILTESNFFDNRYNDFRSISGALVTLKPAFDSTLTFGFERVVYRHSASQIRGAIKHAPDVLLLWHRTTAPGDTTPDGLSRQRSDQITAVSARWVFPQSGFEVYGEWARTDLPRSLTELLTAAHHSGGYTLGFQWAQPRRRRDYLRLQAEVTYLEQSFVIANRPPSDYYSSRATPQGYTQRGQVIGASIGPGASSQWMAVDYLARDWDAGVFAGRVRWENDAMYRQIAPNFWRHDVTMLAGLRGATQNRWTSFQADVTFGYRYNYLFQNSYANPGGYRQVDIRNVTLRVAATPR